MFQKLNPLRFYQRSIAAKVFLLTAGCVVATILSISWLSNKRLVSFLGQEAETNAATSLDAAANSVSGILDYWSALASAAAHNVVAFNEEDSLRFLQNFVSSNVEIVAMSLAGANGKTVRVVMAPTEASARLAPFTQDQVRKFIGDYSAKWNEELASRG